MKRNILYLVFIILSINSFAQENSISILEYKNKIELLEMKVTQLENTQNIYTIENTLIKDTYSSSYDRVQLGITIITLLFGVLAYFGFVNIKKIKDDFNDDHSNLKELKSNATEISDDITRKIELFNSEYVKANDIFLKLNKDYGNINSKIKFLDVKYKEVKDKSDEQDLEIEILTTKDSIRDAIKSNNYSSVSKLSAKGLNKSPKDMFFLKTEAFGYLKMKQFETAMEHYESILQIEVDTYSVTNLAELYLLLDSNQKFNELKDKYDYLKMSKKNTDTIYLEAIYRYNNNDIKSLKELKELVKTPEIKPTTWDFQDVKNFYKLHIPDKKECFTELLELINILILKNKNEI